MIANAGSLSRMSIKSYTSKQFIGLQYQFCSELINHVLWKWSESDGHALRQLKCYPKCRAVPGISIAGEVDVQAWLSMR